MADDEAEPGGDELRDLIAGHPFAEEFDGRYVQSLAGMATRVQVPSGSTLFRTGQPADALYLLLDGQVTLEIEQGPSAILILETLHGGETLGWSWMFAPYRWRLDAYVSEALDAVAIDAEPLRELIAEDPAFGLAVTHRVGRIVVERLHHARHELATARTR